MTHTTQKDWPLERGRPRTEAPPKAPPRHTTIEPALLEALAECGVTGLTVHADGVIHRFDASDKKRGNRCGWYVCPSLDVAVFGFWHTGEQHTVITGGRVDPTTTLETRLAYQRAKEQREAEQRQQWTRTAEQARRWWAAAESADPHHPYLLKKRLAPHGLRQRGDMLLVPLFLGGELVNLQRILPDGSKRFMAGGRIRGAASLLGRIAGADTVYLCEGWATAATLHEAVGQPVVAAMNCGNLLPMARSLRSRLPASVAIIVAADNDRYKSGNAGLTKGREAALAIGARIVWPEFPCAECACSDFNDRQCCALGEVVA
ncbi:toprim domain-containing protein [Kushneria phosphatilytica]|nr:toprim domain-containing protein [Kushneria phosphatilytica]